MWNKWDSVCFQSNQRHLYLQADDKLYINMEDSLTRRTKISIIDSSADAYQENGQESGGGEMEHAKYKEFVDDNECRKQWIVLHLPATYIASNWPLRVSHGMKSPQSAALPLRYAIITCVCWYRLNFEPTLKTFTRVQGSSCTATGNSLAKFSITF